MEELNPALEAAARESRGRVLAQLVRELGSIDAAEEAFQEALLAAFVAWREGGVPASPGAWLTTAARNWARDRERHRRIAEAKAPGEELASFIPETVESIADDQLRLIFTCCHPQLSRESQVALTLKLVAGFTTEEIARAFLVGEPTVAQRIVRAKRTLGELGAPYEVPGRGELPARLPSVLTVVYLLLNEGHLARTGSLMRLDLQRTALRLSRLLCDLLPDQGEVFALFALIAFACARAATRVDEAGEPILLPHQNRARWDRGLIKDGLVALGRARRLGPRSSYVLQADIAAWHAVSPTWDATDWRGILSAYDELYALDPSPVVALNRAVAVCMRDGAEKALAELAALEKPLADYHHFYATRADFRQRLGLDATADLRRALELVENEDERRLLERRLQPPS